MRIDGRQLFSIPETAEILGCGRSSIYRMLSERKLTAVKVGRSTRVSISEIERLLGSLPAAEIGIAERGAA